MGPDDGKFENESTEILDTIQILFRNREQILYAIQYLQRDHLIDEIKMIMLNKGKLKIEQFIFLNRLIEQGRQTVAVAIAALTDTLDGLNMS
jgi:hypothetical protein